MDTGLRKLCGSCRFDKCLRVGMRESAVLSRLAKKNNGYKKREKLCLLEKLRTAYSNLEEARRLAFNIEKDHVPKLCNYVQMNDIFSIDAKLVIENLVSLFQNDSKITKEQQKLLLVHFMVPFLLLEGGFKSTNSDLFILPSGDCVDMTRVEEYYRNHPDDSDDVAARNAAIILKPYWKLHRQTLKRHLDYVQLDLSEFLFVTALIFWDFGLQDQSDDCIEVCKGMRSKIIEELNEYEKNVRINQDHAYRVGEIIIVLQGIQKTLNNIQESREISLVYNLYERHCTVFDTLQGE